MQKNKNKIHEYFLILSVICITISGCTSKKSNILQIEIPREIDLGNVIVFRNKENRFDIEIPLKNLSGTKIQVAQVQTSCKCITTEFSNDPLILEPRDSSVIKLNFIPTELDYGYVERTVFIHFCGYKSPVLITITAIVSNDKIKF